MALAKWYKIDFHTHTPESKWYEGLEIKRWKTLRQYTGEIKYINAQAKGDQP